MVLSLTLCRLVAESLDAAAMADMAKLGRGFLVWERSTGGKWDIWTKSLDCSGEEQMLIPAEEGRDHFCPKISPQGTQVAYLSFKHGEDGYGNGEAILRVWDIATHHQVEVAAHAISYHEDRAVVWFDESHLCYADPEGNTYEADLKTGRSTKMTRRPARRYGFLINPTKTFATTGKPEFAPFNDKKGKVEEMQLLGGCQPYFSADGRWGFWVYGPGGPIASMFLPTRHIANIIDHADARLPKTRNYVYFPMLSPCMRFMAFAASTGEHDHFAANYNVFVARIDPTRLELIGKPVQYTNWSGVDRYPDLYCDPLPLGSHFVTGPTHVTLQAPQKQACSWTVDGAAKAEGPSLTELFATAGDHWVEARHGSEHWTGLVHVSAPRAPKLVGIQQPDARHLALSFDEAVAVNGAQVTSDQKSLTLSGLDDEGRTLLVKLPTGGALPSRLDVSGVRDTAEVPSVAAPFVVNPSNLNRWPVAGDGLLYAWDNQKAALVRKDMSPPERKGKAFWGAFGDMSLHGGSYELPGVGEAMLKQCGASGTFAIEAFLKTRVAETDGESRPILSLVDGAGAGRLELAQKAGKLELCIAASGRDGQLSPPQVLGDIAPGRTYHLCFSYENGHVIAFLNGPERVWLATATGSLPWASGAKGGKLTIGASGSGQGATWQGDVEHLAIYDRVLAPEEIQRIHAAADAMLDERAKLKTLKVTARLKEISRIPTLDEIKPYREALVKYLYEVQPVASPKEDQDIPAGTRIVVSHWVWINGEAAKLPSSALGTAQTLSLEAAQGHGEIQQLFKKNDLSDDLGLDEYLAVDAE